MDEEGRGGFALESGNDGAGRGHVVAICECCGPVSIDVREREGMGGVVLMMMSAFEVSSSTTSVESRSPYTILILGY